MSRVYHFLSGFAVLALLLSACAPVMPAATTATPAEPVAVPHTARADAPPYGVRGSYAVGVRDFVIEPEHADQRQLGVTVWYPALNLEGAEELITYEMDFAPGETPNFRVTGRAIADAVPATADGPFPLIVQTHAHWTFRQEIPYLSEQLAAYGFVVISADHEDTWNTLFGPKPWQSEFRRPDEVRREIDFAATLTAPDGTLAGLIDPEHAGIFGWSFGGETALVAAGARLDTVGFRAFCEENKTGDAWPDPDCVDILDHEAELAALAGLDAVPTKLWPDWSDDRIVAAVALAPWVGMIGVAGLQSVDVPTLLIIGSGDNDVGPTYRPIDPYNQIGTDKKSEIVLAGAGHMVFGDECTAAPDLLELGFDGFCSDAVWDMTRANDLVNHFVTAFMLAELKGDADAAAALAPENVAFPGITYETTAYGGAAAEPVVTAALDAETVAAIEALVAEMMARTGVPGLALGIVQGDQLIYAHGFGTVNLATGAPVTAETIFQVAEVTMTPTAMAILQLAEAGKIDLDAPVTTYLPYFQMADPAAQTITIRQLLMHRAGVPDSGDTAAPWPEITPELDDGAVERFVRSLADRELLYPPGAGYEWSDLSYDILGAVIAQVSGQSYETYMREQVLDPLGMTASTFLLSEVDPTRLATPHVEDAAGNVVVSDIMPFSRQFAGANNLYTNLEDIAKLVALFLNGGELGGARLLPQATIDLMWTRASDTPYGEFALGALWPTTTFEGYGIGWLVADMAGHTVYSGYGGEYGYQSSMILCPDLDVAVIAMGNGTGGGAIYSADTTTDVMGILLK